MDQILNSDYIKECVLQVKSLEIRLSNKYEELIEYKLNTLLSIDCKPNNINGLKFYYDDDIFYITYNHHTEQYDENNYIYNYDSEIETEPHTRHTTVTFGKKNKYFIKTGNTTNRFKIYRNSNKELRIINTDYCIELDPDDQIELLQRYASNRDIPEWLAIKFFLYMADIDLQDTDIIKLFKIS